MSVAEKVHEEFGGPAASAREPRSAQISAVENFLRSPNMSIPRPNRPPIRLATDNVRAPPAITATASQMIGMTAAGLGLWGLMFPNHVKRTLGVKASPGVVRAVFGARELWSGVNLSSDPTRTDVLWARVVADVFDIAALRGLSRPTNPRSGAAKLALGAVLAITALDLATAARMSTVRRNCP